MAVQWTRRNVKTRAAKRRRLENEDSEVHKQGENRVPNGDETTRPQASAGDQQGSISGGRNLKVSTDGIGPSISNRSDPGSDYDRSDLEPTGGIDIGELTQGLNKNREHCGEYSLKEHNLERISEHNLGPNSELNQDHPNSECSDAKEGTHGHDRTIDKFGSEYRPTASGAIHPGAVEPDNRKVRSTMVDYQRDICTQYMKTGRCRYGDACKFAHERGTKTRVLKPPKPAEPLRNGCSECSTTSNMVVPPCKHQYCETCFLKISKADDPCRICSKPLKSAKPLNY